MNMWLVIPLVLSQLAGIAGFILGVVNFRHAQQLRQDAKEAPSRNDQRRYRSELRDSIYSVKTVCQATLQSLKHGDSVDDSVPEVLQQVQETLDRLSLVLVSPGGVHLILLDTRIGSVKAAWERLIFLNRPTLREEEKTSDSWRRKRDAAENTLKDSLISALEQIEEYQQVLTAIDNGADHVYRQYTDSSKLGPRTK